MTWLKSAGWVASCALISVGLGWWLGQAAQDWMAPEVSRPSSLDPEALHEFLTQLPWQAHAARLAGHALGLAVAAVLLKVNTPRARRDFSAFGALMGLGVAFDMWRVSHPAPWTVLALVTTVATLWLSFRVGLRIRKTPDATSI